MRAIWVEPHNVDASKCEEHDNNLRRQLACVVSIMKETGASQQAIDFTRRLADDTKNIGYLSKLGGFGVLTLGTVEWPFMKNSNAHSDSDDFVLNGNPAIVAGNTGCADNDVALSSSAAFHRLKKAHPDITTWEGTRFLSASALSNGGWKFVFSCPLGEFHAEAGRWDAVFALIFDAAGNFMGHNLVRISGERAQP